MPRPRRSQSTLPARSQVVEVVSRDPGAVKSAVRVLEIFELFDELRREARLGEIAARLDYPQSSTSILLKNLVSLGYMRYDVASKTYLPSPRVTLLGHWIAEGPFRDSRVTRLMDELAARTGHTIILGARNGVYAQYIHVVQATTSMRLHVPVGTRRLFAWSSIGFCLMRDTPGDEVARLVRRTNAERSAGQRPIDLSEVTARIARVREDGYIFSRGLVNPGTGLVAMPLPGTTGFPLVLCVAGWIETLDREERDLVDLMRDAIDRYLLDEA